MRVYGVALVALTTAWGALAACSDGSEVSAPIEDGGSDTGAPPNVEASDADAEAETDAPAPSLCTADNICHTELPPNEHLEDVWGDGNGIVWAVSKQGHVLRWDGQAWTIQHTAPGELHAIWGSGPTDLWVGGAEGLFHGQGPSSQAITWTPVTTTGLDAIPIVSIWGSGPFDLWAVAGFADMTMFPPVHDGRVLHFTGTTFEVEAVRPTVTVFTKVWGASADEVWIAGYDLEEFPANNGKAALFQFDPAGAPGAKLVELPLPKVVLPGGERDLGSVLSGAAIAARLVLLGATEGWHTLLVGSADAGVFGWEDEDFAVHPSHALRGVWGTSASNLWVAGDFGRLRHWDGSAWSLPRTVIGKIPLTNTFHAIWGKGDDIWFVGDEIALHKRPAQ